jgi:hypothetical protein
MNISYDTHTESVDEVKVENSAVFMGLSEPQIRQSGTSIINKA